MPWWRRLTAVVIINDVPDEDDGQELTELPPFDPHSDGNKKKTKKKKKEKGKKETEEQPPSAVDDQEQPLHRLQKPSCKQQLMFGRPAHLLYVFVLCVVLGLFLPFMLTSFVFVRPSGVLDHRGYCYINSSFKFSCYEANTTEEMCESLGCCYEQSSKPFMPSCYHSEPSEYGYTVKNASVEPIYSAYLVMLDDEEITSKTVHRKSYRLGNSQKLTLDLAPMKATTPYEGVNWPLQLVVERKGDDIVRLTIFSPGHDEGTLMKDDTFSPSPAQYPNLDVSVDETTAGEFNVTVYRTDGTNEMLLRTIFGPFIMGENYTEVTTILPSYHVYGLGSRLNASFTPSFEEWDEWYLNSRDPSYSNKSLPGTHPFYMCIEPPVYGIRSVHGVYLRTSAPLQIGTIPAPGFTFRTVIGSFKFLVMAGPTPREVSRQYASLVGAPAMPPAWALGFHLCRTAPPHLQQRTYETTMAGMVEAGVPFDSDCVDARLAYPDPLAPLPQWANTAITELRRHRHYFAVTHPFLVYDSPAYQEALGMDLLMKLGKNHPYYGLVSGAAVGYPDYLDENSFGRWLSNSSLARERFSLADAALLLENSPRNDATVDYDAVEVWGRRNCTHESPELCCPRFGASEGRGFRVDPEVDEVSEGTLCWAALHASLGNARHLAHHNAYALHHTHRITQLMQHLHPRERPLVVSAGSHPGTGRWGGLLSSGFGLSVDEQKRSLRDVLEAGLYGVAFAGTPVCGSRNDTGVEEGTWQRLCLRHYQTAIFLPLLVSHYEAEQSPTNPPDISPGFSMRIRPLLRLRYMLVPHLYTLAEEASTDGVPMAVPLFYYFKDDDEAVSVSTQFMVGEQLMIVPNFNNLTDLPTDDVPAYFPPGCWYNVFSGEALHCNATLGSNATLTTLFTDVNAFIRGGHAIFLQGDLHTEVLHTEDARKGTFTAVVALEEGRPSADGRMYQDDGRTLKGAVGYTATWVWARLREGNVLKLTRNPVDGTAGHYCDGASVVDAVNVFGLPALKKVEVNGKPWSNYKQDTETLALYVKGINFNWCKKPSLNITWTKQ